MIMIGQLQFETKWTHYFHFIDIFVMDYYFKVLKFAKGEFYHTVSANATCQHELCSDYNMQLTWKIAFRYKSPMLTDALAFGIHFYNLFPIVFNYPNCFIAHKKGYKLYDMELATDAQETYVKDRVFSCVIRNPRTVNPEGIVIPDYIMRKYNASLIFRPPIRHQTNEDIITFIDEATVNAPIILPRWCVLKHCRAKYAYSTDTTVIMNIDNIGDKMALIVMELFEDREKPSELSDNELKKLLEINAFLTGE